MRNVRERGSRNPLTIVLLGAIFVVGVALTFGLGYLFPSAQLVTIIVGCLVLTVTVVGMRVIMGHFWAYWYTTPFVAIALIGAVMLSEDVALSSVGEPTEVVVVDHSVDVKTVHDSTDPDGRKVYTHEYSLERTDGSPVDEPMIFRGKDGFEGVDEGDTITVLIDPAGTAPTELAENIDFGADIGILITGLITSFILFLICGIVVLFRWMRPPPDNAWPGGQR